MIQNQFYTEHIILMNKKINYFYKSKKCINNETIKELIVKFKDKKNF